LLQFVVETAGTGCTFYIMLADYSGGQIRRMVENVVLIIYNFSFMERVFEGKGGAYLQLLSRYG